jgi:hypothetical protein
LILKKTESYAGIVDQGHMKDIMNDRQGFAVRQEVRKKQLRNAISEYDQESNNDRDKNIDLRSPEISHFSVSIFS